jgi:hypothetical protein
MCSVSSSKAVNALVVLLQGRSLFSGGSVPDSRSLFNSGIIVRGVRACICGRSRSSVEDGLVWIWF